MALHAGAQRTPAPSSAPPKRRSCPWPASQGTKDDYAHTFIVKGIDGPALMKVTDEQLQEWKLTVRHAHVGQAAPCQSARQRTGP